MTCTMETFGEFIKSLRISKQITLREFCLRAKIDPSNWSKIERNVHPAPQSKEMLNNIAKTLGIPEGSQEYNEMCDLAVIAAVPKNLVQSDILEQLPVFFRTMRGDKPSKEELDLLLTKIKSAWESEH